MIPKIIHYCWFGRNALPKSAIKCIDSWRKYLPDYEIKEWNEDNFDVNIIPYTSDAYKAKKYAFVSDYARFWILYQYGGLYFDTDVEVIKSIDDVIEKGSFMGCEKDASDLGRYPDVAPGLGLGVTPNNEFIKEILAIYQELDYNEENKNGSFKTIVEYTSELLAKHGLKNKDGIQEVCDFTIYPKEYFNPLSHVNQLNITDNTRSIHHYAGTWLGTSDKIKKGLIKLLGKKLYSIILKLK